MTGYSYYSNADLAQVTQPDGGKDGLRLRRSGPGADLDRLRARPADGCDLVLDSYAYDPAGLLAATTDAMGRITNDFYDANQDLIATRQQPPPASNGTVPPGRQTALHL